jgi:hypothetical protein
MSYAIGLTVGTMRGLRVVAHGGSWAGYRGHFLRFPDQHFAVATFCNLTTSGPDSLARKVAGIYLADRMQPDSVRAWTVALAGAPRADVPATSLRALAGVWRNVERGEVRRTSLVGDSLVTVGGGERTRIVPLGDGRYRAGPETELRFEGDPAAPSRMLVTTSSETVTFTRADTVALTPAKLAEYAGDYRSNEVETTQTWKIEKGQLVVYANDRRLGVLEPSYKDGFTRGGSEIDVTRDAKGHISGFVLEAGRVRHLKFTRVQ